MLKYKIMLVVSVGDNCKVVLVQKWKLLGSVQPKQSRNNRSLNTKVRAKSPRRGGGIKVRGQSELYQRGCWMTSGRSLGSLFGQNWYMSFSFLGGRSYAPIPLSQERACQSAAGGIGAWAKGGMCWNGPGWGWATLQRLLGTGASFRVRRSVIAGRTSLPFVFTKLGTLARRPQQ